MNLHILIKATTGVFVVPIAVGAHKAWPWWTAQKSIPLRILSGIIVLPLVGIAFFVTPWWEKY